MRPGPKPDLELVRPKGRCGFPTERGDACKRPAGWGTDRKTGPCRDHRPALLDGGGDAPAFLPPKARELWEALAPGLRASGRLEPEDEPAFLQLCISYHLALYAGATMLKEGLIDRDPKNGNRKRKHPAFQLWRDAQAAYRAWAAEFGVTPAERARFDLPEEEELSGLDRLRLM